MASVIEAQRYTFASHRLHQGAVVFYEQPGAIPPEFTTRHAGIVISTAQFHEASPWVLVMPLTENPPPVSPTPFRIAADRTVYLRADMVESVLPVNANLTIAKAGKDGRENIFVPSDVVEAGISQFVDIITPTEEKISKPRSPLVIGYGDIFLATNIPPSLSFTSNDGDSRISKTGAFACLSRPNDLGIGMYVRGATNERFKSFRTSIDYSIPGFNPGYLVVNATYALSPGGRNILHRQHIGKKTILPRETLDELVLKIRAAVDPEAYKVVNARYLEGGQGNVQRARL